ncbi:MAG: sodium:solute symporter [Planctomycetes bacterium GWF2_41_51]|nr:MAG: sodium:solute symporter [Planctomycetes bacterium GWF2_41_51]HBG28032.1 sodium:solute symporter [Phycisphaerales bacterium]
MNISFIDSVIIIIYFIAMAAIGVYFSRKNTSTEEYFVGGRSFPGWIIGLGMVGTSISSVTFVAYPADSFKTSWIRFIPNLSLPLVIILAAFVFLPLFRRTKCLSAYEYLEARFGQPVRFYAASAFVISQLVRISLILYLLSLLTQEMTGLDPILSILITGLCVSLYTVIGGIDAVLWTDVIQTIMLAGGGVICAAAVIIKIPGGLGEIFTTAWQHGKLSFSEFNHGQYSQLPLGFSLSQKTVAMLLIFGFVNWLMEYSGNQTVVQKYFAAKNMKEAKKALWITLGSSLPIWAFYMFVGTALYVFFYCFPAQQANEILNGDRKAEQILPFFILHYLPSGVIGFIIAAALAAAMSSLSGGINSIATVSMVDIYKRYLVKRKDDKHYLYISRAIATLTSILMMLGAIVFLYSKTRTLQDTGMAIASVLSAGLVGIYMIGFFTRLCDWRPICIGILFTIFFTFWTVLSQYGILPERFMVKFDLYYTAIVGNCVMIITSLFFSFVFKRKTPLEPSLSIWTFSNKLSVQELVKS